jgi:hypothetical protein
MSNVSLANERAPLRRRTHRKERHRQGRIFGWIGIVLLVEACIEQFFPGDSFVKTHVFFLVKDVLQSLVAAVFAFKAARLESKRWLALVLLTLLNAVLTLSAGMSLGPDDFLNFLHNLYPQANKEERIHRLRQ